MKKKICFVLPEYARATHFQYVAEFVEGLAEHADIFLIVEKGELPKLSNVTHRVRQRFQFPPLRFFEIAGMLLYARICGYRVQYIHYSFSAAFWSSLITRTFGGMTYYWNAGLPWLYKRPPQREFFERLVYKLIGRLVTGANAIVPGYADYYHIAASKIIVISNWIDDMHVQNEIRKVDRAQMRKKLNIPENAPVVLFVHRLARRKGAHWLPGILAGLNKETILIVVGDGPERETITQEFAQRGLTPRMRMCGALPQTEIANYFAISDIFLLPSEEEGCPHVLLESLAAGVPYAAVAVGGVREMTPARLQPYVTESGKRDELITATNALLGLPKASREEVIKEEYEWVKQYRKEEILERFLDLVK